MTGPWLNEGLIWYPEGTPVCLGAPVAPVWACGGDDLSRVSLQRRPDQNWFMWKVQILESDYSKAVI